MILAGRNAHKVFISASILLGFDVEWLSSSESSYLCCKVSPKDVASKLDSMERKPLAVYITSPDYLGNTADIKGIADVCHKRGVLLLVDNAHGAYLAFTKPSMHPIALGADMCADSAHKTLPCLTGAAYLHIAKSIPEDVRSRAKSALALFGSTSPSYLTLASLDKANSYLNDGYSDKLSEFCAKLSDLRKILNKIGYITIGNEPMKLTLAPKSYGYTGYELGKILLDNNIVPEFYDADYLVLMPTPEIDSTSLNRLYEVLSSVQKKDCISELPPDMVLPEAFMTPREAALSPAEMLDVKSSLGRVLADITVGCPPAVPIVVSGEIINEDAIRAFDYYGIKHCTVVKSSK